MAEQGRWAGRDPQKDATRHDIWLALHDAGVAIRPDQSMLPQCEQDRL
jgi:5-formyltetrahydrofolate cyclo-ligase